MSVTPNGVRVLVVEDEDRLLGVLVEMLQDLGYSATGATTSNEAFQAARSNSFDILLCDVTLGEMRGDVLARSLSAVREFSKVIFMSGWERESVQRWEGHAAERWLRKPFTLGQLNDVLRS